MVTIMMLEIIKALFKNSFSRVVRNVETVWCAWIHAYKSAKTEAAESFTHTSDANTFN